MSKHISVLLVDDHAMVRDTLGRLLREEPDIAIVKTSSNADDAIRDALELKPTVILMDIDMPGLLCFTAAATILDRLPETAIVFLSAFKQDRYIHQALEVGATGYVTKNEPADSLVAAVRAVAAGSVYFSPDIQARVVVDAKGPALGSGSQSRVSMLTNREMEVLRYIAQGMSKKEMASVMHISVNTVDQHVKRLMTKLDIHDRVKLARYAIREGLTEA